MALWAPFMGILLGGLLGLLDLGLQVMGVPVFTRSAILVVAGIGLTGGLHLDGAMDTADGLGVFDPERRLEVMADSRSGAFGVMAAIAIVLLKTAALTDLEGHRWFVLMAVAGWGRWGQLLAIVRYPYLKPTGKGAFHKEAVRSEWAVVPSFLLLLGVSGLLGVVQPESLWVAGGVAVGGCAIAWLVGAWFNYKLGGHTGDTYGAVVEWTEVLLLCLVSGLG